MNFRTDLALEQREILSQDCEGVFHEQKKEGNFLLTRIVIDSEAGAQSMHRPQGEYLTLEFPPLTDYFQKEQAGVELLAGELRRMLPKEGTVLVVGLGNPEITPDRIGPLTARGVLATRHIRGELARSAGLEDLRSVAVLSVGVLGQTGVETVELLSGLKETLCPVAVVVVDALASRRLERLGCTIQLCDSGISPGAGVGNHRPRIDRHVLGVPVIALGVPTVVDAATLAAELMAPDSEEDSRILREMVSPRGAEMMVTPREIDLLVERAAKLLSMSVNRALHPSYSTEEMELLL